MHTYLSILVEQNLYNQRDSINCQLQKYQKTIPSIQQLVTHAGEKMGGVGGVEGRGTAVLSKIFLNQCNYTKRIL